MSILISRQAEIELLCSMAEVEIESTESFVALSIQLTDSILLRINYFVSSWDYSLSCPNLDRSWSATLQLYASGLFAISKADNEDDYPVFGFFTALVDWIATEALPVAMEAIPHFNEIEKLHLAIKEVVFWSHHLLATSKRKDILEWSRELNLYGISKPGYPGIIVVEGIEADVNEFTKRIKSLSWQALQVRYTLLTPSDSFDNDIVLKKSKLASVYGKVECREMEKLSEVVALMKSIGMEDGVQTVLKIK